MDFKQLYPNTIGKLNLDVKSGRYEECLICLRPIKGDSRVVKIDANNRAWKPECITPVDVFDFPVGPDCAKKIGLEWSRNQ